MTLPLRGTFTYRDPRRGAARVADRDAGRRAVRVAHGHGVRRRARGGASRDETTLKDIEEVVAGEPAFDEAMIAFCRWVADYYYAPLGEVLRAALPQGEKAEAVRAARITARAAPRSRAASARCSARRAAHPVLVALVAAGGELTITRARRASCRAGRRSSRASPSRGSSRSATRCRRGARRPRRPSPSPSTGASPERLPARAAARRARARARRGRGRGRPRDGRARRRASARTCKALVDAGLVRVERRPRRARRRRGRGGRRRRPSRSPSRSATPSRRSRRALAAGFATFVLHGVTGSGKTEVYLRVIAEARAARAGRARARAGDRAHAAARGALSRALRRGRRRAPQRAAAGRAPRRLAPAARGRGRHRRWARARRSSRPCRRSASSSSTRSTTPSFKQEEGVRYHGRDLAVVRAQRAGAIAILGSATPSLETAHNAARGRFTLLPLPGRATQRPLPEVELVDLRRHPPGPDGLLSAPLAEAIGGRARRARAGHPVPEPARLLDGRAAVASAATSCAATTARSR